MKSQIYCVLLLLITICPALAFAETQQRIALLVGVEKYEKRGFSNLSYAEDDMTALAETLKKQGFQVQVLLGSSEGSAKANRANIMATLEQSFLPKLKNLNKSDIALIALAGHGRHAAVQGAGIRSEDHFYCPSDSHDTDPATWISLSHLINSIEQKSGCERNLILVDACRDNPSRGRGVDGKGFALNRDAVAVLFASSYNEQAYEPEELQHGLFTYYVLEGLGGAARNFDDEVTWDSLVDFVKGRVERKSRELLEQNKIAGVQRPNFMGNLRGRSPVLVRHAAFASSTQGMESLFFELPSNDMSGTKAGQVRSFTAQNVKFCWCPAGEFTMGSPASEAERNHDEYQVNVTISQGFWLGQTEVTQGLWQQVMQTKPWSGEEYVKEGGNHPATYLRWEDAKQFCEQLTARERAAGRLPKGWSYRLPTEAQWEYACRAGMKAIYSFGEDTQNLGQYAWFRENAWDVDEKYTHLVATKRPNVWNLHDLHGNVWEWCQDICLERLPGGRDPLVTSGGTYRVCRGGCWGGSAGHCRSAFRYWNAPSNRSGFLGFRVALTPAAQ